MLLFSVYVNLKYHQCLTCVRFMSISLICKTSHSSGDQHSGCFTHLVSLTVSSILHSSFVRLQNTPLELCFTYLIIYCLFSSGTRLPYLRGCEPAISWENTFPYFFPLVFFFEQITPIDMIIHFTIKNL